MKCYDAYTPFDNELKKKAVKLKALIKSNVQDEVEAIEYVDLELYEKDKNLYFSASCILEVPEVSFE